jgi:hypothetical protein
LIWNKTMKIWSWSSSWLSTGITLWSTQIVQIMVTGAMHLEWCLSRKWTNSELCRKHYKKNHIWGNLVT